MDEGLKLLIQELGNAINDSLADSDRISNAIGDIRKAGYDVFLILGATIGFNRRKDAAENGDISEETLNQMFSSEYDKKFFGAIKVDGRNKEK
jgi:hypothetical protein